MSDNHDKSKTSQTDGEGGKPIQESSSEKSDFTSRQSGPSHPIAIKSSQGGSKFGVLTARQTPGAITDNNDEPIPLDKIIKTANTMSNMMMAHKIALEADFRLEPGMDIAGPLMSLSPIIGSSPSKATTSGTQSSEPNLQTRVKDIVHEAYWDLFKEELDSQLSENKEERKFDISKQLLRDIRQKIIDLLLPQHTRLKEDLEDKLDSKILDQLSQVESLNLLDYARYILSVLSKLCAPVRDEMLRELSETTDIVQLYRSIMELLELMRLDFANFTLNQFKPHIKAHSQEYEREKFNEILKQQQIIGIDGLEYTKVWLDRAVQRFDDQHGLAETINEAFNTELNQEELNSSFLTTSTNVAEKHTYTLQDKIVKSDIVNKVLNSAYCELLEWTPDKQKLYPETLLFDEATFKQLGIQYKVLVLTSSILLTTFAFVNRFKLHDNNEFRLLVKSHTITLLTASYDNPPLESSDSTKTPVNLDDALDRIKLETIAAGLSKDIRQKLEEIDKNLVESFEQQKELFTRQILDLESSSNRIKELARRRILEFVETLLTIDVKHHQKKFSSKHAPPVNIPLGLNCLADEITLAMAQLVRIIRYNRKVFFQHYQDIIVELVMKKM